VADAEVSMIVDKHFLLDEAGVADIGTDYLHYLQQVLQLDALEAHMGL
jgi:hypothetical protein